MSRSLCAGRANRRSDEVATGVPTSVPVQRALRRGGMQHGWTAVRAPRRRRHAPRVLTRVLIGPGVSRWGLRSADARDQLQLATRTGGTPAHRRGRGGTGGWRDTLVRRDVHGCHKSSAATVGPKRCPTPAAGPHVMRANQSEHGLLLGCGPSAIGPPADIPMAHSATAMRHNALKQSSNLSIADAEL